MKRKLFKLSLCLIAVSLLLAVGLIAFAAGDEFTRDLTVRGITVSAGDKTIENVYSDPVDYWEVVAAGALMDHKILYDAVGERDSVIYTASIPTRQRDVKEAIRITFVCLTVRSTSLRI